MTGTFTPIAAMRVGATATLLASGKVLVTGIGHGAKLLYDPATNTFSETGSMLIPRSNHTVTLLSSGKVLIAGGSNFVERTGRQELSSAELYDPATGSFSPAGRLTSVRQNYTATLLSNGKVLIAGGMASEGPTRSAEIFDEP